MAVPPNSNCGVLRNEGVLRNRCELSHVQLSVSEPLAHPFPDHWLTLVNNE